MAAKFTAGTSHRNPPGIKNVQNGSENTHPEPRTHSFALQRGNTMSGMPGFIKTKANGRRAGEGGHGSGPKREQYIGERGGDNGHKMNHPKAEGTMEKSYRRESMTREGHLKHNDRTGERGPKTRVHTSGDRAPPMSHGKMPGGGQPAGIDRELPHAGQVPHFGHRGRMERLRGHSRGKSQMY